MGRGPRIVDRDDEKQAVVPAPAGSWRERKQRFRAMRAFKNSLLEGSQDRNWVETITTGSEWSPSRFPAFYNQYKWALPAKDRAKRWEDWLS